MGQASVSGAEKWVAPGVWTPDGAYNASTISVLFKIGKLPINTYSLTMMLGILAAILTITIFWRRAKYDWDILLVLIFLTIPSAFIGARLWHLVEHIGKDDGFDWSGWYKIWEGGLAIQGGVVGAGIVDLTYAYTKRDKIDIRKGIDIVIPAVLIGQVIGRWGNFANHELYGKVDYDGSSCLIFGKRFASNMYIKDVIDGTTVVAYRYPLFLYEGLANLVGYILLVWVINLMGLLKPGATGLLYFLWYGIVRLAMEPLRQTNHQIYITASYVFIVIGYIGFIYFQFFDFVHYVREWRGYRFVYQYAHPEEYIKWIEKTRIKTKRSKPIVKVIS